MHRPEEQTAAGSPLLFVPLAVFTILGFFGVMFSPYLLVHHPLVLVALNPLFRHMVLASPAVDTLPFCIVAVTRLFLPDPFMYLLGFHYGPRALTWMEIRAPLAGKILRFIERAFARAWPIVLFVYPTISVCLLAGVARIRVVPFVIIDLAGTIALVALIRVLGATFVEPIQLVTEFVRAHVGVLTLATAVSAFAGWLVWRRKVRERYEAVEKARRDSIPDAR